MNKIIYRFPIMLCKGRFSGHPKLITRFECYELFQIYWHSIFLWNCLYICVLFLQKVMKLQNRNDKSWVVGHARSFTQISSILHARFTLLQLHRNVSSFLSTITISPTPSTWQANRLLHLCPDHMWLAYRWYGVKTDTVWVAEWCQTHAHIH